MNTVTHKIKINILFFLLLSLAAAGKVQAQNYGNEWIDYSQTYYKIKVIRNGIHRLDYNFLNNAGLSAANPQKLQLFRRGKEVPLFVNGETDGRLDAGDYVEFYGERNDGKTDVELYQSPAFKVHDYYSLYTDTAAYFLTVSPANGKRVTNQSTDASNLTPESWHHQTRLAVLVSDNSRGMAYNDNHMPWGDKSEGFFSEFFGVQAGNRNLRNPYNVRVDSLFNLETTGPAPTVEIALVGTYYSEHDVTVSIISPTGAERVLVANYRFGTFDHVKLKYPLQFNEISSTGNLNVRVRVNTKVPSGGVADLVRVAYAKVRYPRKNNLTNKELFVSLADSNKTTPSFLVFDNLPANGVAYDVTDQENIIRADIAALGNQRGFIFNGSPGKQRKILITTNSKFINPVYGGSKTFRQVNAPKVGFIIVSHKSLAKPVTGYSNPVKAYADYRASTSGGKYDTLVLYTDQVYDQFHYGDHSALAIRRLMQYLMANGKPQYLFLLGKGIEVDYGSSAFRRNPKAYPIPDLVPTGGAPGSDVVFTADFHNRSYTPKVPTGRVSAVNASDVAAYLDKIKQHEATPQNAEWRKNILHLGGGINLQEQNLFRNYLRTYENMAENPPYGALVESITRNGSTSSTTNINVSSQVNNGLSLITFFGHSSASVLDLDIGYATNPINNYNNSGKYPMILLNGCNSGNTFSSTTTRSFGEDWILAPRKGAIIFLAHSALGYTTPLNIYSRNFYSVAFSEPSFYGKSIGIINQEVVNRTAQSGNELLVSTALEMVMQADPAVVLFGPDKPDYAIKNNISIAPINDQENVTSNSESFRILIPVKNLGKATQDSFKIKVTRNDQVEVMSELYPPIYNQDTVTFVFSSTQGRVAGINTFKIMVDAENTVDELDESNNTVQFEYNFPATGSRPLMPVEYAIVNTPEVKLVGQASNLLQASRLYTFELDTTRTFNSPAKQTQEVTAGSLPSWTIKLLSEVAPNDSLVYYWRFRPKEIIASEDTIWGESSFRFIPAGPEGWSQSQPGQFTKARTNQVNINEQKRQWEFVPISKSLSLRTIGGNIATDRQRYGIFVNNLNAATDNCSMGVPNILIEVFNNRTLEPYVMPTSVATTRCGELSQALYYSGDLRQAARRDYLRRFLEAVPVGYYVAVVTINPVPFADFSNELKNAFRAVGSKLIDNLASGAPLALIGQKGAAAGTAQELTATSTDPALQTVELNYNISGFGNKGSLTSTLIGPATNWQTLYHAVRKNGVGSDRYTLKVSGLDIEGKNERVLYPNVKARNLDISAIDANIYPYLQLSLTLVDSLDASAPQLEEWRVHYTGVPEGIVRPDVIGLDKYNSFASQAQKGKIDAEVAFQNISNHNYADSLLARVTLIGANGFSKDLKLKAVAKDETIVIPYTFATNNLSGNYTLRVTVNPLTQNPMLRPEQYYFNNTLEVPFALNTNLHPVLDVVFDGRHILDGDIVSPNPLISMTLKDEDQYTFLKDPSHMEVYVKAPGASDFTPVNLSGNDIKYFTADKNNDFRLEYSPKNLPDGVYTLRVQGRDVAENKAGFEPYTINFEVINESAVSHFYPYPNPFSSKTRFVFTLTGSTIPQDMKIQIMTVTGKVVREIMKDELGPLKIGNNISEFAWDGTDEFGDKLANGVYLYRVVMDTGEQDFKHRNTAGDKSFKKDYGKIYILR
ncbi:MAG: C25 family cysteine peptidase [Adhaeribacter sp.]